MANGHPFINVSDYGAVGDGITDDTSAIQQAINAAPENYTVMLEADKNYRITSRLDLGSVVFDGNNSTITASHSGDAIRGEGQLVASGLSLAQDYIAGQPYLTLTNASSVQVGQILRVISNDLYDDARSYYYKGGNFLVTAVEGNTVYLSQAMPFDFLASSLQTIQLYNPIRCTVQNLKVTNSGALPNGQTGVEIRHGLFCQYRNLHVDNFVKNVVFHRSVSSKAEKIHIGRSYYVGTSTSYGARVESCTATTWDQIITNSGRHGYSIGGWEPSYGNVVTNSQITYEEDSVTPSAFDAHENNFDLTVIASHIDSFKVGGNVRFERCTFGNNMNNNILNSIYPSNKKHQANYTFENCTFLTSTRIITSGYGNRYAPARIHIGNIVLRNCYVRGQSLKLELDIAQRGGDGSASISNLTVENTNDVYIPHLKDAVQTIHFKNVFNSSDDFLIKQKSGSSKVNRFILENVGVPERYQVIEVNNFDYFAATDCYDVNVNGPSGSFMMGSAGGDVRFTRCTFGGLRRGMEVDGALDKLYLIASDLSWYDRSGNLAKINTYVEI